MADAGNGLRVGFIGAGQMATALAKGFVGAGSLSAQSIMACDVVPAAGQRFVEQTGARLGESVAEVANASNVIFLAVKPQQMAAVFHELRQTLAHDPADRFDRRRSDVEIDVRRIAGRRAHDSCHAKHSVSGWGGRQCLRARP